MNYGWAIAAALIMLAGLAGVWFARQRIFGSTESHPIRSLAVLPMTDLSGDSSQAYFADGMTETLIA